MSSFKNDRIAGLYAIADTSVRQGDDLREAVTRAIQGGARLIQYRDKGHGHLHRQVEAAGLLGICRQLGVPLIINDDVDLTLTIGADGVHLGKDDADPVEVRHRLGDGAIIGVSCYNDLERARTLAKMPIDYLAFGSVYPSHIKPDAVRAELDLLRQARALFDLPLVAIGGITADNAAPLIDMGIDAVAVITDVFARKDPFEAAQRFSALFRKRDK